MSTPFDALGHDLARMADSMGLRPDDAIRTSDEVFQQVARLNARVRVGRHDPSFPRSHSTNVPEGTVFTVERRNGRILSGYTGPGADARLVEVDTRLVEVWPA